MTIRTTLITLLACGLGLSLPAAAQDMKPGLWEQTNNASSSDPNMQATMDNVKQMLAKMTPEQRQSMQQMLQKNGVQMDLGPGGALRSKVCITPEMIARKELPMQEGDCTHKMTPVGPNRLDIAFSCTRPNASGEGEMTIDTPTSYHARMHIRDQAHPNQSVDMDVAGRWLAGDCGAIKPIALPGDKRKQ